MAYSLDSSVNRLAKVEGLLDAIQEITGTKVTAGMLAMGGNMSLMGAGGMVGWTEEQMQKIVDYANSKDPA